MYKVEERHLSGRATWGDDFDEEHIHQWFTDEIEAYADLGAAEHSSAETYGYHQLNIRHGFRHLPEGRFPDTLGLGSAFGGEFLPIADRLERLTILEPSERLRSSTLRGIPIRYDRPVPSGDMPFADATFDLVTSFGTLHHVANVTHVISEMARVTKDGATVLISEPIRSMGDWRLPREGLTQRERGIPLERLWEAVDAAALDIQRETRCMFPTTGRLGRFGLGYNSRIGVGIDRFLSVATAWNDRYHSTAWWHKLHAVGVFYVLRRRPRSVRS